MAHNDKSRLSGPAQTIPLAQDDYFLLYEDEDYLLDVLANDRGGKGRSLYSLNQEDPLLPAPNATTPLGVAISRDGALVRYASADAGAIQALGEGERLTDSFTYSLQVGNGSYSTATAVLDIVGRNDAPEATDDFYHANEDIVRTGNVLENDIEIDASDTLRLDISEGATFYTDLGARVTLYEDGNFSYDPTQSETLQALDFRDSLLDSFEYTVTDGIASDTAMVDINVQGDFDVANGVFRAAYMTSGKDPWEGGQRLPPNAILPDSSMDLAFGEHGWDKVEGYTTDVFDGDYDVVHIEGTGLLHPDTPLFANFIFNNRIEIEDFVEDGGAVFINTQIDGIGTIDMGHGLLVVGRQTFIDVGTAVDPDHPLFHGPVGDAGTAWNGSPFFAFNNVTGPDGATPLILGSDGEAVLTEMHVDEGYMMVGTLDVAEAQENVMQAEILRANLLVHAASQTDDYNIA